MLQFGIKQRCKHIAAHHRRVQDREFITAPARQKHARLETVGQLLRHAFEYPFAQQMAGCLVMRSI
jgi:hypothetical protein